VLLLALLSLFALAALGRLARAIDLHHGRRALLRRLNAVGHALRPAGPATAPRGADLGGLSSALTECQTALDQRSHALAHRWLERIEKHLQGSGGGGTPPL
jgi:hypothetical protein